MFNNNFEAYVFQHTDGRFLTETIVRDFGKKPEVQYNLVSDVKDATFFKYNKFNVHKLIVGHIDSSPLTSKCKCLKVKVIQSYWEPTEVRFI